MAHYNIDKCRESMVRILKSDREKTAGSGFMIREDGYLITCHHVIYQLERLWVEYQNQVYEAQWCQEFSNPDVDIAILKIAIENAIAVNVINPSQLSTSVTVYGFPPTQEKYFPQGYPVSAQKIQPSAPLKVLATYGKKTVERENSWNILPQENSTFRSHRIDAKVDKGTSGGAVIAEELGGVVGIIQCSKSDESYVIRWDNILSQLVQLELEPKTQVIRQFLEDIEDKVKDLQFFHVPQEKIPLKKQYIDIQVTLERKFKHIIETSRSYAESEADYQRIYALKGKTEAVEETKKTQVDWQDAKKDHQKIMVLADPGMGKSTLLKQEALTAISTAKEQLTNHSLQTDSIVLPLLIRLSKLAESQGNILERIFELLQEKYGEQWREWNNKINFEIWLRGQLKHGKCLLLLDALDEVPKKQRLDLKERLNRFGKQYPCPMILTSRIVGYDGAFLNDAKDMEIVPFGQQQTKKYIENWFKNAEDYLEDEIVSATGLITELDQKPQIQGLVQNPLLLSLLCSLYQTQGLILPARRTQVYQQAVHYMLKDWSRENERKLQREGWVFAKIELLEFLAYQLSFQNKEVFLLSDVHKALQEYLANQNTVDFKAVTAADLLEELTEEDGIIQKLSRDGKEYLFLHRTFQEYLTATYLKRAIDRNPKQSIALVIDHVWEYDWHETISLVAGLMDDPIPLLQAITREKDDIFKTLLLLAGLCLTECEQSEHPFITKIVHKICKFWQSYPEANFIESILVALGKTNHHKVVEILIAALNHSDWQVRGRATKALGKIGNAQGVEALIAALNHSGWQVRESAAEALEKIGNAQAVEALIVALNHSNDSVRRSAAEALGKIGDAQGVEALIAALNDSNDSVRRSAAEALGEISDTQGVEALIAALNDSNDSVRWRAAEALGEISDTQGVEALIALSQVGAIFLLASFGNG